MSIKNNSNTTIEEKKNLNLVPTVGNNLVVENKESHPEPNSASNNTNTDNKNIIDSSNVTETKKNIKIDISKVLIFSENMSKKKKKIKDTTKFTEFRNELCETPQTPKTPNYHIIFNDDKPEVVTGGSEGDIKNTDFLDTDGFFITAYPDTSDSDDTDEGGQSGYEADIEDELELAEPENPEIKEEEIEPPILYYGYNLIIKRKKRFRYNNLIAVSTNFLLLNYINYLFYKQS
jgi:hypothetical protein